MTENSILETDLSALRSNVEQIRREIGPDRKLIPVLKGDAYGLGAVRIARFLSGLGGIDTFAVSHVQEGIALREAGIREQILVMSLPLRDQMADALRYRLVMTLGGFHQFRPLRELAASAGRKIPVNLKLDTGLHRIGFLPEETDALCGALLESRDALEIVGTFSHHAAHDPETLDTQDRRFEEALEALRAAGIDPGLRHIAASASLEADPARLYDAVRVGRRLFLDHPTRPTGRIREAVSFRTRVTDVRIRKAGETLGYEGRVRLDRDARIGVLAVGYGDGLDPALAGAGAPVLVNGEEARLLAVCMDQSFIRLDGIPCEPGDEATLFGRDREGRLLSAQRSAGLIGWEGCDLTSRLTPRVKRVYLEG